MRHANNYLDQKVAFNGIFNSFNGLALDYKAAFRDSKDFLSFMIFRPDVEHHKIPCPSSSWSTHANGLTTSAISRPVTRF
ncbi:MAG: hypothetical protein R2857_04425 [Vampirovibrionales bacterium]